MLTALTKLRILPVQPAAAAPPKMNARRIVAVLFLFCFCTAAVVLWSDPPLVGGPLIESQRRPPRGRDARLRRPWPRSSSGKDPSFSTSGQGFDPYGYARKLTWCTPAEAQVSAIPTWRTGRSVRRAGRTARQRGSIPAGPLDEQLRCRSRTCPSGGPRLPAR